MKHAEEMQEQAYSPDAPGDSDYPQKVLLMELPFSLIACFSANSFPYLHTESCKHD